MVLSNLFGVLLICASLALGLGALHIADTFLDTFILAKKKNVYWIRFFLALMLLSALSGSVYTFYKGIVVLGG